MYVYNPQRMRICPIDPAPQSTSELLTIVAFFSILSGIAACILVVPFDSLACMHAWNYSA